MDLTLNNLLGKGSSDATQPAFMPEDTIKSSINDAALVGLAGNLLTAYTVYRLLTHQQEQDDRAHRHQVIEEYVEDRSLLGAERERAQADWLARQRAIGMPPPLERGRNESAEVFDLKAQARAEFLRDFSR